ncbi:MAG: plastocyanin/azurin family copper-binding protein [Patescibacteria group bacterium]
MKKASLSLAAAGLLIFAQGALAQTTKATPNTQALCIKDANDSTSKTLKEATAAHALAVKKANEEFAKAKKEVALRKEASLKLCKMPKPAVEKKPAAAVAQKKETPPVVIAPKAPTPVTVAIGIREFAFSEDKIRIKKGTTVTWTNNEVMNMSHSIESDIPGKFTSPLLARGESFSYTFNSVGLVSYHCGPHQYMTGEIMVTE